MSGTNRAESEETPEPGNTSGLAPEHLEAEAKDGANFADVKQLGLVAAITSLSYVFWICGGMEMIERLAYYGVKAVATLYAQDPVSKGGLGVTLSSFGNILATSDKSEIFNGICGAESGSVPVAAISPALLVSSIEIQRKERSQDQPPYLPRPEANP